MLQTGHRMDHQQYLSRTSILSLGYLSPFAIATYLSCALDSTMKCYNSLQRRLPEIEKDIVTARSSKERRRLKRIRYHINHDIRLCRSEMEALIGAMDSARLEMEVQYQQELEHRRSSRIPLQQCLNGLTFPTYGCYASTNVPALRQHQRTSWGPIPYNYDPYAAVATQYAIQQAFMLHQPSPYPTFQYPCCDQLPSSPFLYGPGPTIVECFPSKTEGQFANVNGLTESTSGPSVILPSPPTTNSSPASRRLNGIGNTTSTIANSLEEPSSDEAPLTPPSRRYSAAAIDLLLYRFRTSGEKGYHRRVHTSQPEFYGRRGSA